MQLKKATKFRYKQFFNLYIVFFLLISAIQLSFTLELKKSNSDFIYTYYATAIFLFVISLALNTSQQKMFFQNGCSRQTVFNSFLTFLPAGILVAISDTAASNIFAAISRNVSCFYYKQIFKDFNQSIANLYTSEKGFSIIGSILSDLLINIFLYCFAITLGYFISTFLYRLNKSGKRLFFILMPIFIVFLLFIENMLNLGEGFVQAFLFGSNYMISLLLALLSLSVFLISVGYLLGIKMPVKE